MSDIPKSSSDHQDLEEALMTAVEKVEGEFSEDNIADAALAVRSLYTAVFTNICLHPELLKDEVYQKILSNIAALLERFTLTLNTVTNNTQIIEFRRIHAERIQEFHDLKDGKIYWQSDSGIDSFDNGGLLQISSDSDSDLALIL